MERHLYIIAGCNGAGKTTASYTVLPEILMCKEFVNADEIAHGLSPFNPDSVAIEAGRLMLKRIRQLINEGENFSIETTLATRSYARLVKEAHENGYEVHLLYFWLESPELAVQRVAQRVSEGGHNISEDVIRRRYDLGLKNLKNIFMPIVDEWFLFDNTSSQYSCIAQAIVNKKTNIYVNETYNKILNYYDDRTKND